MNNCNDNLKIMMSRCIIKCRSLTYLPRFIKIRDSFPKNQGGKVDMQQLAGETDGFIEPAYVKKDDVHTSQ